MMRDQIIAAAEQEAARLAAYSKEASDGTEAGILFTLADTFLGRVHFDEYDRLGAHGDRDILLAVFRGLLAAEKARADAAEAKCVEEGAALDVVWEKLKAARAEVERLRFALENARKREMEKS